MHDSSHDGIVFSRLWSLYFPALISVEHCVLGWANSILTSSCTALLCWLIRRLFMCLFLQHDRWRQL